MKIAFSGAGAYGISYIGVVKALEENNIKPEALAGTSMGAIIASWWSAGLTWQDMAHEIKNIKNWWFWTLQLWEINDILSRGGIADSEVVINQMFKHTLPSNWKDFKIPLQIATTNITKRTCEVFSVANQKLSPSEAVYASMAVPGAFRAFKKNGNMYVDGGLVKNEPVDLLGNNAILVLPDSNREIYNEPHGLVEIGAAIMETIIRDATLSDLKLRYYMVESGWKNIQHFLDFENVDENIEIGYKNGIEFIKEYNYAD